MKDVRAACLAIQSSGSAPPAVASAVAAMLDSACPANAQALHRAIMAAAQRDAVAGPLTALPAMLRVLYTWQKPGRVDIERLAAQLCVTQARFRATAVVVALAREATQRLCLAAGSLTQAPEVYAVVKALSDVQSSLLSLVEPADGPDNCQSNVCDAVSATSRALAEAVAGYRARFAGKNTPQWLSVQFAAVVEAGVASPAELASSWCLEQLLALVEDPITQAHPAVRKQQSSGFRKLGLALYRIAAWTDAMACFEHAIRAMIDGIAAGECIDAATVLGRVQLVQRCSEKQACPSVAVSTLLSILALPRLPHAVHAALHATLLACCRTPRQAVLPTADPDLHLELLTVFQLAIDAEPVAQAADLLREAVQALVPAPKRSAKTVREALIRARITAGDDAAAMQRAISAAARRKVQQKHALACGYVWLAFAHYRQGSAGLLVDSAINDACDLWDAAADAPDSDPGHTQSVMLAAAQLQALRGESASQLRLLRLLEQHARRCAEESPSVGKTVRMRPRVAAAELARALVQQGLPGEAMDVLHDVAADTAASQQDAGSRADPDTMMYDLARVHVEMERTGAAAAAVSVLTAQRAAAARDDVILGLCDALLSAAHLGDGASYQSLCDARHALRVRSQAFAALRSSLHGLSEQFEALQVKENRAPTPSTSTGKPQGKARAKSGARTTRRANADDDDRPLSSRTIAATQSNAVLALLSSLLQVGQRFDVRGSVREAEYYYNEVLRLSRVAAAVTSECAARLALADLLMRRCAWQEVQDILAPLTPSDDQDARDPLVLLRLGDLARKRSRSADASALYSSALEVVDEMLRDRHHPDSTTPTTTPVASSSRSKARRRSSAVLSMLDMTAARPLHALAGRIAIQLARVHRLLGREDEAAAMLQRASVALPAMGPIERAAVMFHLACLLPQCHSLHAALQASGSLRVPLVLRRCAHAMLSAAATAGSVEQSVRLHVLSIGVGVRHRLHAVLCERVRNAAAGKDAAARAMAAAQLDTLSHFDDVSVLDSVPGADAIPSGWVVVAVSLLPAPEQAGTVVLAAGQLPALVLLASVVRADGVQQHRIDVSPELVDRFEQVARVNDATCHAGAEATSQAAKRAWWQARADADDALRVWLTGDLDPLAQAIVPTDTEHVVLVLDKQVQRWPWECVPSLYRVSVSRLPCFPLLPVLLRAHPAGNSAALASQRVTCLINPSGDLVGTQARLQDHFASWKPAQRWTCVYGERPSGGAMLTSLQQHDVMLYCGHGGGEAYVRPDQVAALPRCALTLLMGCSSGVLREPGALEPDGILVSYLLAGSRAVVATLWDVTDRDIDRLTVSLLQGWKDASSLCLALPSARGVCLLPHLVGAAPVIYGLKV